MPPKMSKSLLTNLPKCVHTLQSILHRATKIFSLECISAYGPAKAWQESPCLWVQMYPGDMFFTDWPYTLLGKDSREKEDKHSAYGCATYILKEETDVDYHVIITRRELREKH